MNTLKRIGRLIPTGSEACNELWPRAGSSDDEERRHYRGFCVAAGWEPSVKRPTLLAMRGVWLGGRRVHPICHVPIYDDAFVLLQDEEAVCAFRGATHPYQNDGGMIRPGKYRIQVNESEPPIDEGARKLARGVPTEILLLPGYDAREPGRRVCSAVGCQTAGAEALRQVSAAGVEMDYLLMNAVDLVRAVRAAGTHKVANDQKGPARPPSCGP